MSSSSSVCQGLQSCLEPLLIEPRVLRLKLATHKPHSSPCSGWWPHRTFVPDSDPEEETIDCNKNEDHITSLNDIIKEDKNNGELGGWSFIQALANTSHRRSQEAIDNDSVYVHPLTKLSASRLSQKSLEMCTESLGSESGSTISDGTDEMFSLSAEDSTPRSSQRVGEFRAAKKNVKRSVGGFPPPLTSISGSNGCVKVRPHREGGRLVISAVTVTESRNFHVDRSDGRLRLRLVKEGSDSFDEGGGEQEEEEARNLEENGDEDEANSGGEEEATGEAEQIEEEGGLVCGGGGGDGDDDDDDEGSESACWSEEMEGNSENVGGETGTGKFPRPRRCRSGNLDPFWGLPTAPLPKPISQF